MTDPKIPKQKPEPPMDMTPQTLDQIRSGVMNPLRDHRDTTLICSLSGDDPLERVFKFVDSSIYAASRLSHRTTWHGIIIRNDTAPASGLPPRGVLPQTSGNSELRSNIERGAVRVYIPELHSHLPNPENLPSFDDPPDSAGLFDWKTDLAIAELYPRCYGPADYLRAEGGNLWSLVEVEFPIEGIFEEGNLVVPEVATSAPGLSPPPGGLRSTAKKANRRRQTRSHLPDSSPLTSFNKVEKAMLNLPPPKARPSPRKGGSPPNVDGFYHTSVDKELLKYTASCGELDWTGCGGRGPLVNSPGSPAKGKKKHYIEDDSKYLVELPPEYVMPRKKWVKVKPKKKGKRSKRVMKEWKRFQETHVAVIGPLKALIAQARKDGIPYPILTVYSTYRSLEDQRKNFKHYLHKVYKGNYAACRAYNSDPDDKRPGKQPPGGDHYSARGVDFFLGVDQNKWSRAYQKKHSVGGRKVGRKQANKAFKNWMSKQNVFKWLKQNAEFFGFYNWTKEPWHYAFNPDDREGRRDAPEEFGASG